MLTPADFEQINALIDEKVTERVTERLAGLAPVAGRLEPVISLRQAARELGRDRQTVKKLLLRHLGLAVPSNGNGSAWIRRSDIERLQQILGLQVNWTSRRIHPLRKAG